MPRAGIGRRGVATGVNPQYDRRIDAFAAALLPNSRPFLRQRVGRQVAPTNRSGCTGLATPDADSSKFDKPTPTSR